MKSILLIAATVAGSLVMAALTHAQQGLPAGYSNYGYAYQDVTTENDLTPNVDSPIQPDIDSPTTLAPIGYSQQDVPNACCDTAGCDTHCVAGSCGNGCCGNGCVNSCGIGRCGTCGGGCKGRCLIGSLVRSTDRNWAVGVRALIFERDYEDDISLGSNAFGDYLFSTDANHDWFGGLEATISSRACTGCGWEFGYWGLFPRSTCADFGGAPLNSNLHGLEDIEIAGTTAYDAYNSATSWCFSRETELHNFEFNLLRNGGAVCGPFCRSFNLEWLGGVRWLSLQEELGMVASGSTAPLFTQYDLLAQNHLWGLQLGARMEYCICNCWTATLGSKFGVYYNDIYSEQCFHDEVGNVGTVNNGTEDYDFSSDKSDVATLGELEAGINYQFNACTRATFGYRIIGISGVALAANQIPYYFNDIQDAARIKSNSGMLLHGFYFGLERAF